MDKQALVPNWLECCVGVSFVFLLMGTYYYADNLDTKFTLPVYIFQDTTTEASSGCKPVNHIYYVKIPKTGSSTMANIIHRIAYENNLVIPTITSDTRRHLIPFKFLDPHPHDISVVSESGNEMAIKQLLSNKNYLPVEKYDAYTDHSYLNYEEIKKYYKKDTKIIATCRHPLKRLISHVNFSIKQSKIPRNETHLEYFVHNIQKYSKWCNTMARYLDLNETNKRSEKAVNDYIEYLGQILDFVLITEKYDESLVLLRRKFCWNIKNILHFDFKKRDYKDKNNDARLKEYEVLYKDKLFNCNKYDYKIYNYFLKQHADMKRSEGIQSVEREVKIYSEVNLKVTDFCFKLCKGTLNRRQTLTIKSNEFSDSFIITNTDCMLMYLSKKALVGHIMRREYHTVCQNQYFKSNYPQFCPGLKDLEYIEDCNNIN